MFRHKSIDMIHGPLLPKILIFALPLMASNLLQLLFNAADIIVVGRFSGPESQLSLAAVGSTTSIVALFVYLLVGLSVGVNVIAAHCYGAGNQEEIGKIVHTSVFVALSGGLLFTAAGLLASRAMLAAVSTPEEVFSLALLYIRIYFFGIPFTLLYNYGAALLRARGDTERPLLYLTASGLLNVVLNLFFVVVLHMNVAGVALATVLSQGLSAGLILRFLIVSQDELHLDFRKLRPDRQIFLRLMQLGLPAGLQSSLFSIANIVIQAAINSYGSTVMAAVSAAFSIESFLYVAMNSFHHAAQTFTGQNLAAGEQKRADRVLWLCLRLHRCGRFGVQCPGGTVCGAADRHLQYESGGDSGRRGTAEDRGVNIRDLRNGRYSDGGNPGICGVGSPDADQSLLHLHLPCGVDRTFGYEHKARDMGACILPPISWAFLLIALAGYMVYLRHRKKPPVPTGGF